MDREAILKAMTVAELAPAAVDCELTMQLYSKLSISRIAALGVGLEPVMAALQQMTSHGQAVSGHYKVTLPAGTHLAQFKNSPDFLGTALSNGSNTIAGQAHLTPILCNPTMLFMAATLSSIDQKLETICTGTGYLRNAGKDGMVRETVGNSAISKGLGAVLAGIGAAAYHLS